MYSITFCFLVVLAAVHAAVPGGYVVIKNPAAKLVVAVSGEHDVVVSTYKDHDEKQIWKFVGTLKDTYFIINKGNGQAIETIPNSISLRTANLDECKDQQWKVSVNNTITNVDNDKNFDINGKVYEDGTAVIGYKQHGDENQVFVIESV